MTAEPTFYRDLAYVFGAAVVGGAVARVLRQPLILGYVLGGVIIGPFTPGVSISNIHQFEILAEIGVILLMYSIGLEFSFRDLLKVKWVAIIGGPLGVGLSILLGLGLAPLEVRSIELDNLISHLCDCPHGALRIFLQGVSNRVKLKSNRNRL